MNYNVLCFLLGNSSLASEQFRRRGITEKKAYNIQNKAKVSKSRIQCTNHQSISVADFGWRVNHVKLQYHLFTKSVYLNFAFGGFWGGGGVSRQPPSFFGCAPLLYWMNFLQLIISCSSYSILCGYLKPDPKRRIVLWHGTCISAVFICVQYCKLTKPNFHNCTKTSRDDSFIFIHNYYKDNLIEAQNAQK